MIYIEMQQYFACYDSRKFTYIFLSLLFSLFLYIFTYLRGYTFRKDDEIILSPTILFSNNHTHDFRLYPQSRSSIEYKHLQIDNIFHSMFLLDKNTAQQNFDPTKPLIYSPSTFRSLSFPVIWLDEHGDVHWNRAAQHETLKYLLEKQFPNVDISTCLSRQLFVLQQSRMGFFSRFHCFVEHFGQTLYSPSMALLSYGATFPSKDDFYRQGILRYFQSISLCSSYLDHPKLKTLHDQWSSIGYGSSATKVVDRVHQLLERDETTVKYKYSQETWKFGYDHVPHRRWLFDRNRTEMKKMISYRSPIEVLINHSNEHIYYNDGSMFNVTSWISRNEPQAPPKDVLDGTTTHLTIHDRIFTSFLRYMFLLFFSPLAPRIQTSTKLLAHYWSEYLSDKHNQSYKDALSNMAAIYIRRGDKMLEDSFWHKHKHWRNISMYVKGIVDEEKRRQTKYKTIFVTSDDTTVLTSIQEYATDGLNSPKKDELYARKHLRRRHILYNIFVPDPSFGLFSRVGFDHFLVNIEFISDYASLVVGHTDSNVGRYLEEIFYVKHQHEKNVQTSTYVINAPDTLD